MDDFEARLAAWRALSEAEQWAYFRSRQLSAPSPRLAAVAACPDRGSVLPISQQVEGCAKCGELSECRALRGSTPGRVTLRECLICVSADTVRT